MSGICGILRLDGAPTPSESLEAMASQLQTRGPDGTHLFHDGSCALGHTLLATTPEYLHERPMSFVSRHSRLVLCGLNV